MALAIAVAVAVGAVAQEAGEGINFSSTNRVAVELGRETPDDGVRHLPRQTDGRTTLAVLDGVPCRYLNRKVEGKTSGYLYFAIHPEFKIGEWTRAQIEFEYFTTNSTFARLQYDAIVNDVHKPYKATTSPGGELVRYCPEVVFNRWRASPSWQKATFIATNAVFANSQNGGADFRLELNPPEIYVRRVTVTLDRVSPRAKPLTP